MNVSLQNIDKVSALLTVKLEKADYQEKVDKSLKSFRQKAQIPGFRKGMVPMSLVKKMYGKSALAEEVNKLLSETVYKYIQDNKVNILGEPLPNEDKQKDCGFKIVAATEKGDYDYTKANYKDPVCIIMGAEDTGVPYEHLSLCDEWIKIPLMGKIESLNVSVAAGILIYEAVKQRGFTEDKTASAL